MFLKKIITAATAILCATTAIRAQSDSAYDVFDHYDKSMNVLIGWGGLNVAAGIPMMFSEDERVKRIGSQSLLWGAINTGIGVIAKSTNLRSSATPAQKKTSFKRAMVINGLLDVAYITTGILLSRLGKSQKVRASGVGVIVQGSFLLGFDWANYGLIRD
jgi:hypothetical protein